MTKAKQEEIIIKALKCYQKELINQISFHNSIGKTDSIHRALVMELHKAEDIMDNIINASKKPKRRAKAR